MTIDESWYGVRCVFAFSDEEGSIYEERVTLWRSESFESAVEMAEQEADGYAATLEGAYLGLAQAYHLAVDNRPILSGDEVFSLMRRSALPRWDYVTRFFDTGHEYQRPLE